MRLWSLTFSSLIRFSVSRASTSSRKALKIHVPTEIGGHQTEEVFQTIIACDGLNHITQQGQLLEGGGQHPIDEVEVEVGAFIIIDVLVDTPHLVVIRAFSTKPKARYEAKYATRDSTSLLRFWRTRSGLRPNSAATSDLSRDA